MEIHNTQKEHESKLSKSKKTVERRSVPLRFSFTRMRLVLEVGFLLAVITIALCAFLYIRDNTVTKQTNTSKLVTAEIIQAIELTTIKYRYQAQVLVEKDLSVFGYRLFDSHNIVFFDGIIHAGIDFTDAKSIQVRTNPITNSISVILPETKILSNNIESQEVFDEDRSVFLPISVQSVFDEINVQRNIQSQRFIDSGGLQEAQQRSELLVERLLSAMGFEKITITSLR